MSSLREIKVPPLGESITEATIARWTKKPGEAVVSDELLVELETAKITLDVTASESGVLSEIRNPVGSIVGVGHVIGIIDAGAKTSPTPAPEANVAPVQIIPTTQVSPVPSMSPKSQSSAAPF